MNEPDLNDIRVFVMIGQAGTLTGAARALAVPASTVSRALTRLEKHLGLLLAKRSSKGLVLTDSGKEYLRTCRRALRLLTDARGHLEGQRSSPSGLMKVACPVTMTRDILAPLLKKFLVRYPDLRVEIEPYAAGWDQEPKEDIDVFFKLRAPRDSARHIRPYPGTVRGLFASAAYLRVSGNPTTPDQLPGHSCIGSGVWKLSCGDEVTTPDVGFRVVSSDPVVNLELATNGLGIAILPLWMAKRPDVRDSLVPVLPRWSPEPITVCALFSGSARLTPKVKVLLDFLDQYIGTDQDPRLREGLAKDYFTDRNLAPTSGP